ncbi:MAG: hypothetical protein IT363_13390 [Methanoregulaceae archaeon]|nr:hypothetical protein [Methanoregulaceae archaeon]
MLTFQGTLERADFGRVHLLWSVSESDPMNLESGRAEWTLEPSPPVDGFDFGPPLASMWETVWNLRDLAGPAGGLGWTAGISGFLSLAMMFGWTVVAGKWDPPEEDVEPGVLY